MATSAARERQAFFHRARMWRRIFVAWVIVFTVAVAWSIHATRSNTNQLRQAVRENRRLAQEGKEAHISFCVLKHDLETRVNSSKDFLAEHPSGIPGVPRSVILQSIKNQQATLNSLRRLRCPKGGK